MSTTQTTLHQVSAANTNRDGTGTIVDCYDAGSLGTLITKVQMKAVGSTSAGMLRMYLSDGTNIRLYQEFPVASISPSASVSAFERTFVPTDGIWLPTGWSLQFSTHNAETYNVVVTGEDAS
jgi:hypothetical protein